MRYEGCGDDMSAEDALDMQISMLERREKALKDYLHTVIALYRGKEGASLSHGFIVRTAFRMVESRNWEFYDYLANESYDVCCMDPEVIPF